MSEQLKHLPSRVRDALVTAEHWVQNLVGAERLWERVLTPGERKRLGNNLPTSYQRCGGTIGIWLQVRGGTIQRAIVEAAHALGFLTEADRQWLLRELDEPSSSAGGQFLIEWNRVLGELRLNGKLIRKVRLANATHLLDLLDAFQDAGWPEQIEDPLSVEPNGQLLRETLRTLNNGLTRLRFFADGTGHGIRWERH